MTLATAQFLMTLDSSVMNVSIATVAEDVGTDVTGIQTAITLYTLVMASLMITGGKIGGILGRKRAFAIGCVIYGAGSLTTALATEPAGAHLRLVAARGDGRGADHARDRGPGRDELRGPGAPARLRAGRRRRGHRGGGRDRSSAVCSTTYASWRWVFAGEVVLVAGHPRAGPTDGRRRRRPGCRPRPGRHGAVGPGAGARRARHPQGGHLGLRQPQARRSHLGRPVARGLDGARQAPS